MITITRLILFLMFGYFTTKYTISFFDMIFFYIFGIDEIFIEESIIQEKIELSEKAKFAIKYMEFLIEVASHIEYMKITSVDFYKNTKLKVLLYDLYYYFRYDFVSKKRFFLKVWILMLIFLIPLAIYESYEYGFPKEYLYIIPICVYSFIIIFFGTVHFWDVIEYIKNCWIFEKNLYIPEISSWEEYIYLTERESYFLEKLRIFYSYMSTESINWPLIELWEGYTYESRHKSIVRRFYDKFIEPKLKWPTRHDVRAFVQKVIRALDPFKEKKPSKGNVPKGNVPKGNVPKKSTN